MPFKATFDGTEISALSCDEATWREAQAANRSACPRLVLTCCGRRAFAKVSALQTRFFQHAARPAEVVPCAHEGESESHRQIKLAIVRAINGMDGWSAEEEVARAAWRADILARPANSQFPCVAFEVQLSRQSGEVTRQRDAAYAAEGVAGVWLVNLHNDADSFGSARRLPLKRAANGDIERGEAAARAACSYLRVVEWQVKAAHAAVTEFELHGTPATLRADRGMPAFVNAPNFGRAGGVRMIFAAAGLCEPKRDLPRDAAAISDDKPFPIYVRRKRTERNRMLDRYAISSQSDDPEAAARDIVRALAKGDIAYLPWFPLPASLVHYTEVCRGCLREFEVCRWALVGAGPKPTRSVPEGFKQRLPFIVPASELGRPDDYRPNAWSTLAQRLGGPGRLVPAAELGFRQGCPDCHKPPPAHRPSRADAYSWHAAHQDGWWYERRDEKSVWTRMAAPRVASKRGGSPTEWEDLLAMRSAAAHTEVEMARRVKRQADRERAAEIRRWREDAERARIERLQRDAQENADQEEAARIAAERWSAQQREEAAASARAAAAARLAEAEAVAARVHPGRPDLAALWLNSARAGGSLRQKALASEEGLRFVQDLARRDRR